MEKRSIKGVMGDKEHAEILMLCGAEAWEYEWHDLIRLSETVRRYAMGRELADIKTRIEELETASSSSKAKSGEADDAR